MCVRGTFALLAMGVALSACAENVNHLNTAYLDHFAAPNPTRAEFPVCHGFGCSEKSYASLSDKEWREVTSLFRPRAKTPRAERQQVARAVALIERLVGPKTGTASPQWTHKGMLIYPNFGDPSQLDCVDASVNTWTYMTLIERAGLLHFHHVAQLSNAGSLTDPFMRNTAVLQEINGEYYAIDASLVDNGVPPPIMRLATWLGSWPPDPSTFEAYAEATDRKAHLSGPPVTASAASQADW